MLIGIDASRALRTNPTGTERYAGQIIRHLLALPEAERHRWRLYTGIPAVGDPLFGMTPPARITNVEWRLLPGRRLWTHRRLAAEVLRHPPDVLFIPSHVAPFVLPSSRLPNIVVTVHDLGVHYFPAAHTRFQRLYLTWGTRWSVRVAAKVIAVSGATATDLHTFYAVPTGKIHTIYEAAGPVPENLPESRSESRLAELCEHYRLPRRYALYVGTIQPRKNLARLIQAYARLCREHPLNWDLVLAGNPGWLSRPLYDLAATLNLSGRIHFTGYVADADLPALLTNACFFCYPSLFEGFGLPVLEAQSIGVPVMTANTSSLPEVAGDAALLVDPTDVDAIAEAMLRLSQDEALRHRLIEAGYANVKRFSWEKAARETLAVLEAAAQTNEQPTE